LRSPESFSYWHRHGHYRAFAWFTLHFDFAAVQVDAALHDHQTKPGAWTVTNVISAVERVEEPLSVCLRNSDALVADGANNLFFGSANFETHPPPRVRVLHGVG